MVKPKYSIMIITPITLISCSSTKILNKSCYVLDSQKILNKNIKPDNGTINEFIAGGITGIVIGGTIGATTSVSINLFPISNLV